MKDKRKTVFVGVSGGVDSSVSLTLLKDAGYNVVGVFIRTWTPEFIECTWRDERRDAMRVCAHLDVPFLECDAEEAYKKGVADYMIAEYKAGRTPNPDVMCNREVKFGVFWQFAKAHGADFIATGHYAQVSFPPDKGGLRGVLKEANPPQPSLVREGAQMLRGIDASKDQSYFLWTLTPDDLSHTLFPIGHMQKSEVRKLAEKFGLPTATKKDSQGVCFLGPLDMKDFLKHYIQNEEGNVENTNGEIIGTHDGALFYTIGERHGFTITKKGIDDTPYYIVAKDITRNVLIVSHDKYELKKESNEITLQNVVVRGEVELNKNYTAQVRYHGELLDCKLNTLGNNESKITFANGTLVDKGQSVVIYDKDVCVGGGIVK